MQCSSPRAISSVLSIHTTVRRASFRLAMRGAMIPASCTVCSLRRRSLHMHSTLSDMPVESLLASVDSVPSAQTTIRTMHRQLVEAQAENRRIFSYERVWDVAHQRLCGGTWIGKHLHANLRSIQIPPPESIKNIKKYNGVLRWQLDGLYPEDCPLMYFSWAGAFSVTVPSSILGVEPALEASPMEKSPRPAEIHRDACHLTGPRWRW